MPIDRLLTRVHRVWLVLVVLCMAFASGGCSEDSPMDGGNGNGGGDTLPPPVLPPDTAAMTVRLVAWDDLSGGGTKNEIPAEVDEILFELTAPDIQTQLRSVAPGQDVIEETFTVATGAARRIKVQAFDAVDTLLYSGTKFVDISDSLVTSAVGMVAATDDTPPLHPGAEDAVAIADDIVLVTWPMATDGPDPDLTATYLIFMSTVSGSFDYSSPPYVAAPGETSYLVGDLAPGTDYYFVVRAMDRAGNVNQNTSQQAVTTPGASGALYVDIKTGANNPSCGTSSSPCKTITYALSKASADQTIHVAKGVYTQAKGEVFPLELKPGTALIGDGYWWMGVKVIKETYIEGPAPVILGADNASVVSCYIKPTGWGTSAIAIDDGSAALTVHHCTVDGVLDPRLQGIAFYGASSLIDSRVENFDGAAGRAVGVWGSGGGKVRGNVVRNCTQGIFTGASDIEISNNVVLNITSVGISVDRLGQVVDNVVVFRNHVENTGGNGISFTRVTDSKITWNTIAHTAGYGISIWNYQYPAHTVNVHQNSITHGGSSAIYILGGQATITHNAFVCNTAGAFVRSDQVIDLRWNEWDHDSPIVNDGRGPNDPGCDPPYDICYEADYALTPPPQYIPDNGQGSCIIYVVPSPPK